MPKVIWFLLSLVLRPCNWQMVQEKDTYDEQSVRAWNGHFDECGLLDGSS